MKKIPFLLFLLSFSVLTNSYGQEIILKKGVITDSIKVTDKESYALFLPSSFNMERKWPVLYICDMEGRGKQVVSMFRKSAEARGYILVASNSLHDSISVSQNILTVDRLLKNVATLIPVETARVYAAGFSSGARFASLLPSFMKQFKGVISLGAPIPNYELLTKRKSFHFIGVVGDQDYNYPDMRRARTSLRQLKFPNVLWIFDGGSEWPEDSYIDRSLNAITLRSMAIGATPKNEDFIENTYRTEVAEIKSSIQNNRYLEAYRQLDEVISLYQVHRSVDSLLEERKSLRKNKLYRTQRKDENTAIFKESLMRDEYQYNLLEDISTLNYNNLGWWNYQVGELNEYAEKSAREERNMGLRLLSYLNALVEDNIDIELGENPVNDEAVSYLWMLKTITEPDNFDYYLKIISDSSKYEDFGTALFYLEELLKRGYKDKASLYKLENTALLRITPEFNELIEKYLKDARYEIIEE